MGQNQSQEPIHQGGFVPKFAPELNENIYSYVDAPTYTRGTSTSRDSKEFQNQLSFLRSIENTTTPNADLVIKLIEENNIPPAQKSFHRYLLTVHMNDDIARDKMTEILDILAQNMNHRKCLEFINSYPGLSGLLSRKYPGWDHVLFQISQEYDNEDSEEEDYADDEESDE